MIEKPILEKLGLVSVVTGIILIILCTNIVGGDFYLIQIVSNQGSGRDFIYLTFRCHEAILDGGQNCDRNNASDITIYKQTIMFISV